MDRTPSVRVAGWILTSVGLIGPLGLSGCGSASDSTPPAAVAAYAAKDSGDGTSSRLTPCSMVHSVASFEPLLSANHRASYAAETSVTSETNDDESVLVRLAQMRPLPSADGPALTAAEAQSLAPLRPADQLPQLQTFPPAGAAEESAASQPVVPAVPDAQSSTLPQVDVPTATASPVENPVTALVAPAIAAPESVPTATTNQPVVSAPVVCQPAVSEPISAPLEKAEITPNSPPVAAPAAVQPELPRTALAPPRPLDAIPSAIATNMAGPACSPGSEHTPRSAEMDAVIRRATATNRHAFDLAEHGAIYSARAEFISALRTIAEALDAQRDNTDHVRMLEAGLRALQELDDFSGREADNLDDLNLDQIVAGHRTPVLKDLPKDMPAGQITAHRAMSLYLTFAEQRLAACAADIPAGSTALYGLGKIYTVPDSAHGPTDATHGAKAVAMQEAALAIDARNFRAANELGVLLVRFGRLPEARAALLHSIAISPQPVTWQNLATVHRALGQNQLAAEAGHEAQILETRQRQAGMLAGNGSNQVHWVDPGTFARSSPMPIDATPGAAPSQATSQHSLAAATAPSTSQR